MLKLTAVVSLVLIVGAVWASSMTCDSCGSECASACGTRHFRACCFNYLRRKRGNHLDDLYKLWTNKYHVEDKMKTLPTLAGAIKDQPLTSYLVPSELEPNLIQDTADNRYDVFLAPDLLNV